ncbi:hypothetical protein [Streptomyces europaeiscabiei]|uniref:hypothetical protein n=1 Tax=Streptomyces europaeiscabiei TaxID=146819 RepID=UPI0029BE8FD5|nr:hypothetical protein [Streptomyces europaeiscabiei]MDX3672773.1 hypothetical protein [Streptomyces europaeiscabiei]
MPSENTPQSTQTAPAPLTPDIVNAIILDDDSPWFPSRMGVYCDTCGLTFSGEFMVSIEQTKAERLEVARAHMREQGWQCDALGDYCPKHASKDTYVEPADRPAEWARMARELAAEGRSREDIAVQLCVDLPTVDQLLAENA